MNTDNTLQSIEPNKKKIGFALGGGGARGLAHIGILKVFEEFNIRPDIIVGTSIGAIIGALYAGGLRPVEIEHLVLSLDWKKLLSLIDVTFPLSGLFHGRRVVSLLKSILGNLTFDQLSLDFSCVTTDIINGEQVVLRDGSLIEAVRASISIPGIFTPVSLGDRYLVDGGLVNTVPVSVCRDMGADVVVGINVIPEPGKLLCNPDRQPQYPVCLTGNSESKTSQKLTAKPAPSAHTHIESIEKAIRNFLIFHRNSSPLIDSPRTSSKAKLPTLIHVLSQTFSIIEYQIAIENLKKADIAINPEVGDIGFWQFYHGGPAIAAGEQAARLVLTPSNHMLLRD